MEVKLKTTIMIQMKEEHKLEEVLLVEVVDKVTKLNPKVWKDSIVAWVRKRRRRREAKGEEQDTMMTDEYLSSYSYSIY